MRAAVPALLAVLLLVVLVLVGCAQVVPGRGSPVAAGAGFPDAAAPAVVDPGVVDASSAAATATAAIQDFWRAEFPAAFGERWTDIATFLPATSATPTPPCVADVAEVADQAYYCPSADAVVWDAEGLVPALYDGFGHVGVVVVLAHEIGHAVQTRLGLDAADPQRHPTILLEAMADCYTGVVLRHLADDPAPGLPVGPLERDAALRTLVGFRDPLGVAAGDEGAHGNAFDRLSAFRAGYDDGAGRCSAMTVPERGFTQVRFGSAADLARAGDLPLPDLLGAVEQDAGAWAVELSGVPGWTAPRLVSGACPDAAAQGPARLCPIVGSPVDGGGGPIDVDPALLGPLHRDLGDFAGATLISGRYALAALRAAGAPVQGLDAGHAAVCLAGAYAGQVLVAPVGFRLSPGDLDEAVQVLLVDDWAARDTAGRADPAEHGYERVARYEDGLRGGPDAC